MRRSVVCGGRRGDLRCAFVRPKEIGKNVIRGGRRGCFGRVRRSDWLEEMVVGGYWADGTIERMEGNQRHLHQ